MGRYIATEGCTLDFKGKLTNTNIAGSITPVFSSAKYVVSNKHVVYQIDCTISGYTNGSLTNGQGTGTITGTAKYVKVEEQVPILELDESPVITINGNVGSHSGTTMDIVYVKEAGQNVLKAT